jgi:hypothetical protein
LVTRRASAAGSVLNSSPSRWPRCAACVPGLLVGPDAANVASRRVLEKNGFALVAVRPVATEPGDRPISIYRLPGR